MRGILGILAACLSLGQPGIARADFAPQQNFTIGGTVVQQAPGGLAMGDLDGDGKPEIVSANLAPGPSGSMSVLRNTSVVGNPNFAAKIDVPLANVARDIALADFDGDGKLDVVTLLVGGGVTNLAFQRNTTTSVGTVTLASPQLVITVANMIRLGVADFTGDGRPDVAVLFSGSPDQQIIIAVNTTSTPGGPFSFTPMGTFSPGIAASPTPGDMVVGDMNGDAKPDLVVVSPSQDKVRVWRNNTPVGGTPQFVSQVASEELTVGDDPRQVVVADLNSDGKLDIATSNLVSQSMSLMRNTTAAAGDVTSFATDPAIAAGFDPVGLQPLDYDGDGRVDLAVFQSGAAFGRVRRNTTAAPGGSISFSSSATSTPLTMGATWTVAAGDVDSDGYADIVIGNGSQVQIQRSRGRGLVFPVGTGPIGLIAVDFDNDGKEDLAAANYAAGNGNTISVLKNTSGSNPNEPISLLAQSNVLVNLPNPGTRGLDARDANLDGLSDLLVLSTSSTNVLVFPSSSGGGAIGFGSPVNVLPVTNPVYAKYADIDGNGKPDVVILGGAIRQLYVAINSTTIPGILPAFTFSAPASPYLASGTSFAIGDLNADGKPDIVVGGASAHRPFRNVSTSLNPAGLQADSDFGSSLNAFDIAIGDIDGDGKPDVVSSRSLSAQIDVFRNTSSNGGVLVFSPTVSMALSEYVSALTLADYDNDGKLDIVGQVSVSDTNPEDPVFVILNQSQPGAISFRSPVTFSVGNAPAAIAAADLDGDAKAEFIVTNTADNTVGIHRRAQSGQIRFGLPTSNVNESAGSTSPQIQRVSGLDGQVSATVSRTGGSASVPGDATFTTTTVTFPWGEPGNKTVAVGITDDPTAEGNETVVLGLSNPTFASIIGTPGSHTVTIVDNECTPRPPVGVSVAGGGPGILNVTLTAGGGVLSQVALGAASGQMPNPNVQVSVNNGAFQNVPLYLSPGTSSLAFRIRRATGSGAATLNVQATDGCGAWQTLVGGGTNAWGGSGPESPGPDGSGVTPLPTPVPGTPPVAGAACATFPTHAAAQAHLRADPTDPLLIDRNRNGIACEGADGAGFVNPPLDQVPVPRP